MNPDPGKKGFTLIELLITISILILVLAVIYGIFIQGLKSAGSQNLTSQMQMGSRSALDFMTRELRLMGYEIDFDATGYFDDGYPAYNTYGNNDPGPKLVRASSNQIVFAYFDTSAVQDQMDNGQQDQNLSQYRLVQYIVNNGSLYRTTWRWKSSPAQWEQQDSSPLIDNVLELNFNYFDNTGTAIGNYAIANGESYLQADLPYGILPTEGRAEVAKITFSILAQQDKPDPIFGTKNTYRVTSSVDTVNMISQNISNYNAPSTPMNLVLTDPHICGTITATWNAVTSPGLAGYVVTVLSAGLYSYYNIPPNVNSTNIGQITYDINNSPVYAIQNNQPASATVSAYLYNGGSILNSASSNTATITPESVAPPAVAQPSATADRTGGNWVTLTWAPPGNTDIGWYNIYRRVHNTGNYALIGNAAGAFATTYTDTPLYPGYTCAMLDYEIQAVNACNNSLVSAFSNATYGDYNGSACITSCVPSNSDTKPSVNTAPPPPGGPGIGNTVLAQAGYRRNYLNWNNPTDPGLASIVIRYAYACGSSQPGAPQTITSGTGVEDQPVPSPPTNTGGTLSPETSGAVGQSYTHYGGNDTPQLGAGCTNYISTYTYSLFAEDQCGNVSNYNAASATTVGQCGENTDCGSSDLSAGAPNWNGFSGSNYANFAMGSNTIPGSPDYTFTWNHINDSYPGGIYDLAGYYVYKTTGNGSNFDFTGSDTEVSGLVLNPATPTQNPQWSDNQFSLGGYYSYDDNPAYLGNTYSYYVIPIDCNRQINLGGNPWAYFANTPASNGCPQPLQSNVLTMAPGRPTFNVPNNPSGVSAGLGNTPSAQTANLQYYNYLTNTPSSPSFVSGSQAVGPEIVVGDLNMSNWASPTSNTNFQHNTLQLKVYNSSADPVTLNGFTLTWNKPSAYLDSIYAMFSGGIVNCVWGTCLANGSTRQASPVTVTFPYTPQLGGVSPTCSLSQTYPCYLPLELVFLSVHGRAGSNQDMRFDSSGVNSLIINTTNLVYQRLYTSTQTNGSQSTAGTFPSMVTYTTPMLTGQEGDNLYVSRGPSSDTTTWEEEFTGTGCSNTCESASTQTAGNHFWPNGNPVTVYLTVRDNDNAGIANMVLYYATTSKNISSAPTGITNYSSVNPGITSQTGNLYVYEPQIPAENDQRVWYFMLAQDKQGNWVRQPSVVNSTTYSAFTYDQGSPCGATPSAPSGLTNTISSVTNTITISWTAPTTNTDGSSLTDLAGYNVQVSINNGTYAAASCSPINSPTTTTCTINLSSPKNTTYTFEVDAFDTCGNQSAYITSPIITKNF